MAIAHSAALVQLHQATQVLREAIVAWLSDLVPPYVEEVLHELQDLTAQREPDLRKVRNLVSESG